MQLRWTNKAVTDLASIRDFIASDDLAIAQKIVLKILAQADSLLAHPQKGRPGRVANTKESLVPKLPYFLVYRVKKDQLQILRVLHTSRRYP